MSFEEIFIPGFDHAVKHLNEEKVLPAPTPSPGDKPLLGDEDDIVIPEVTWGAGSLPEPHTTASDADASAPPSNAAD
jgi:hypothetical protein